jgi:tetratricopeptide (TPR) repeat protein
VDSAQDQLAAIISTPYYFGTQETPWSDSVKFYAEAHGAWQAIAWPLKPVDGPGEFSLKVDGETRWIIDFDVNPEDAESITAGRYRVKALMTASTADGTCSVEVESNMVTIDISGQPAPQTNERLLQLAWYHGNKGEYELQLEYARQVLRRHPDLPIALFFEGEAEAGRGNHTEALRSYTAALHEFDRQHPDSFERPELVVQRIVEVRHKLAPRGS